MYSTKTFMLLNQCTSSCARDFYRTRIERRRSSIPELQISLRGRRVEATTGVWQERRCSRQRPDLGRALARGCRPPPASTPPCRLPSPWPAATTCRNVPRVMVEEESLVGTLAAARPPRRLALAARAAPPCRPSCPPRPPPASTRPRGGRRSWQQRRPAGSGYALCPGGGQAPPRRRRGCCG